MIQYTICLTKYRFLSSVSDLQFHFVLSQGFPGVLKSSSPSDGLGGSWIWGTGGCCTTQIPWCQGILKPIWGLGIWELYPQKLGDM